SRDVNEDAHTVVSPEEAALRERKGHLIAIADGLGGHEAGQIASSMAIQALVEAYFAPTSPSRVEPALQHAVQVANLKIHEVARGNSAYRGMQTTLSALVLAGGFAYVAHVGDSRVYLKRPGKLSVLTNDHSEAAELVRMRLASAASLATHPRRNVLTRTLGSQLILRPDFRREPVAVGDTFILCTDGLWSEVTDEELAMVSDLESVEAACEQAIDLQLARESMDNATIQVVKVLATDDAGAPADGWLNTIVNRFVGSRDSRDQDRRRGPH
ncbi:MAG TPA: protein phosphatase 2C domain-containing protein, partial [Chloroflexota bacterium]|nr:protein phosphatase 2C domain-containing protein [Chloroflexota bacterium]